MNGSAWIESIKDKISKKRKLEIMTEAQASYQTCNLPKLESDPVRIRTSYQTPPLHSKEKQYALSNEYEYIWSYMNKGV